jgi:hypothetical protein
MFGKRAEIGLLVRIRCFACGHCELLPNLQVADEEGSRLSLNTPCQSLTTNAVNAVPFTPGLERFEAFAEE